MYVIQLFHFIKILSWMMNVDDDGHDAVITTRCTSHHPFGHNLLQ